MAFAKMHKRFYDMIHSAKIKLPENFEFSPLEAVVICEKIILEGHHNLVNDAISFVEDIKELIHAKKIDPGKKLPSEESHIAAEILGNFSPTTAPIFAGREKYLPFYLYAETPYHLLIPVNGAINITYEKNSPVIAIPAFYNSTDRPSAIEYLLWLRRDEERKKMEKKITNFLKKIPKDI